MTFPILSASLTISWSSLRPRGEVVWVNTYFQPTDVRSTLLIGLLFYFSRTQGRNHLPSHQLGFLLSLLQTHPCKHQTKVSTSNHSLVHRLDPFGTLETYISKWISGYSHSSPFGWTGQEFGQGGAVIRKMLNRLSASSARLPDKPLNPQSDLYPVILCSEDKISLNVVE